MASGNPLPRLPQHFRKYLAGRPLVDPVELASQSPKWNAPAGRNLAPPEPLPWPALPFSTRLLLLPLSLLLQPSLLLPPRGGLRGPGRPPRLRRLRSGPGGRGRGRRAPRGPGGVPPAPRPAEDQRTLHRHLLTLLRPQGFCHKPVRGGVLPTGGAVTSWNHPLTPIPIFSGCRCGNEAAGPKEVPGVPGGGRNT